MDLIDGISALDSAVGAVAKLTSLYKSVSADTKSVEIREAIDAVSADLNGAREKLTLLIGENLSMKQQMATLAEQNLKLTESLRCFETFDDEARRYELTSVGQHTTLYAMVADQAQAEPSHYLCVHCFEDRRKSILQLADYDFDNDRLVCGRCSATYLVPNSRRSAMHLRAQGESYWTE